MSNERGESAARPSSQIPSTWYAHDPKCDTYVEQILGENNEPLDLPTDSDDDPDFEIQSDHESDVLVLNDDNPIDGVDAGQNFAEKGGECSKTFYFGKNHCFKWRKEQPPRNLRTRQHNIVTQLPGPWPPAKIFGDSPDIEKVWSLYFTDNILEEILKWTNVKIGKARLFYSRANLNWLQDMDIIELKAFLGLLVFTSVFKSEDESVHSLFATDGTGRDIFRCTMTKQIFVFLFTCLQFDNPSDREERKMHDPTAPISNIFSMIVQNSQHLYSMGAYVCIDEMLVPFCGWCKFRMYMPSKPANYGIKVQCLTDARTNYLYNAYIYARKGSDGITLEERERKKFPIPTQSIIWLILPIENTGRNLTADNWFTSVDLATELLKRGITYVGTMKKNKREIPPQFLPNKTRGAQSSLYGFTEDLTLLSYIPDRNKAVVLISSMHHDISQDPSKVKPEIVQFYNLTKGGVDSLDQKCSNYSSSRRTRRWPMAIFFMLLDAMSGVNAYILYSQFPKTQHFSRLEFLKNLGKSLVMPQMKQRYLSDRLPRELRFSIERILPDAKISSPEENTPDTFENRKTCSTCPPKLKRKTKYPCKKCQLPICLECSTKICKNCFD